MRAALYDVLMLAGAGLVVAGVAMLGGVAPALIVAGVEVMVLTRLAVGAA